MRVVPVDVAPRPYRVSIGSGLAGRLGELEDVAALLGGRRVAVVSDETVFGLHGGGFLGALAGAGASVAGVVRLAPGEENKNVAALSSVWDGLVAAGLERSDLVVAFGGGVVGDIAGFAAATYLRGVDFIQVPTTLLAMVDSSVGGKTGVDHPRGKNLLGAFHQPRAVVADVGFLATLPVRERLSGLAEAIKAGILADPVLFGLLEARGPGVADGGEALVEVVARSVAVKAVIVAMDEREGGPRALLNFGHTLGHAVEAVSGFSGFTHGEAVALGMVFATRLSRELGGIGVDDAARIERLLIDWGFPQRAEGFGADEIRAAFAFDKKKASGRVRWVLPVAVGEAKWGQTVDDNIVDALLVGMQGRR